LGRAKAARSLDDVWRALEKVLVGLSRDGPVIFAIEDIHYLGPSETERLDRLARTTIRHPVMMLFTHRGELPEPLAGLGHHVELGPFDKTSQRRLLEYLFEATAIGPDLLEFVNRTCEGNPLYVEEMAKFLIANERITLDDGSAELIDPTAGPELPMSLAGLLQARIDALDPAAKGALQLAAVIGTTFTAPLLAEAAGVADATPLVSELSGCGLIAREEGADQWVFASDLVRAAALRGALGVQRRRYHSMVASAMETIHADDLARVGEALASHCAAAERWIDAARYANMAGQKLEDEHHLDRARQLYERALAWVGKVERVPETWDARVQGEAMLNFRSGRVSFVLGETRRAERSLQLALDISSDSGLPWIEVRAHQMLGRVYLALGKPVLAEAHVDQARSLARVENDPELLLETLEAAANLAHVRGRTTESQALWNEALGRAEGNETAVARCKLGMSSCLIRMREYEAARTLLSEALHAAREAGNRILIGRVLNNAGLLHFWVGHYDQALAAFREALEIREGIGYTVGVVINHHNIGDVHFSRGDMARAFVAFDRSRELALGAGWKRGVVLNDVYLGYIHSKRASVEDALTEITRATERARALGDVEVATTGEWLAGRLLVEKNRPVEARPFLDQALAHALEYDLGLVRELIEPLLDEIATDYGA
jgi:tetratricopeptide (TPR) repeat protein